MKRRKRMWILGPALAIALLLLTQSGPAALAQRLPGGGSGPATPAGFAAEPSGVAPPSSGQPVDGAAADGATSAPETKTDDGRPPADEPDRGLAGEADSPEAGGPGDDSLEADSPAEAPADCEAAETGTAFGVQSTVLDAGTIIVYTFDELAAALSQNNGYTTIYIGADITGKSGGAQISPSKAGVVIDGCPPGAPAGTRYTYTDYDSSNYTDALLINSGNTTTKSVTVQNLNVVARNYYGIICCYNASSITPTVTYSNVTYSGPQAAYNRYGTLVVEDSSFAIVKNGSSASQEFAEANRVEFVGTVSITSASTGDGVLWMSNAAPALVVRGGANVTVNTANYFIYNGSNTAVTLESGASLSVTTATNGFTYGTMTLASLSLAAGASLGVTQNGASDYGALRVSSTLAVGAGAWLDVQAKGTGAGIQFTGAGAAATFTDPARVRILAASRAAFGFTSGQAGSLSITAGTLNLWGAASSLAPSAFPTAMWNRAGSAALSVQASYLGDSLSSVTSNLLPSDPVPQLITQSNFSLRSSQLVAFGACPLSVDSVSSRSGAVTGTAGAGAALTAAYTSAGGPQTAAGTAGGGGAYTLALAGGAPAPLSTVTVTAAWNGLYSAQATVVADAGALGLASVPGTLDFGTVPISAADRLVPRRASGFAVSVSDTRLVKLPWALLLSVDGPLTAAVGAKTVTLPGALVFVGPGGSHTTLDTTPLKVYTHPPEQLTGTVNLSWGDDEGVMLLLPAGQGRAGASYSTTLHWTLVDAP